VRLVFSYVLVDSLMLLFVRLAVAFVPVDVACCVCEVIVTSVPVDSLILLFVMLVVTSVAVDNVLCHLCILSEFALVHLVRLFPSSHSHLHFIPTLTYSTDTAIFFLGLK